MDGAGPPDQAAIEREFLARSLAEGGGEYAVAYAILQAGRDLAAAIDSVDEAIGRLGDILARRG
jgi:hypothetical protein